MNTTNNDMSKVTWEIPLCDGLPPIGTKVASGKTQCTIRAYLSPDDPRRPVHINGNTPWVSVSVDGLTGIGFEVALSDVAVLSIEKQPEDWPYHTNDDSPEASIRRQLGYMILSHRIEKEDAVRVIVGWLKDQGYLKR